MPFIEIGKWPRGTTSSASGENGLTFAFKEKEVPRYAFEILKGKLSPEAIEIIAQNILGWLLTKQGLEEPSEWHRKVANKVGHDGAKEIKHLQRFADTDVDGVVPTGPHSVGRQPADGLALVIGNELREAVEGLLSRLPRRMQQALRLHFMDGLSWDQVGEAMGITGPSAKQNGFKGLEKLRDQADELRRIYS